MATIAKLDSNGVQVLPEHQPPAAEPVVHSSTDERHAGKRLATGGPAAGGAAAAGDPNEDWCAVCMDGGELMCCDKCPKVFHQYCHIPTIEKLPEETETWQCLLCVNFAELPPEVRPPGASGVSAREQKLMERVTLELYCQYEPSLAFREPVPPGNTQYHSTVRHTPSSWRSASRDQLYCQYEPSLAFREPVPPGNTQYHSTVRHTPSSWRSASRDQLYCQYEPSLAFREPVPPGNTQYHSTIQRPMCLDMIRMRLQPRAPARYTHVAQFVADVRLLFRNAAQFNPPESQIYKDAVRLEEFFDAQLAKWLPEYAFWSGEGEPPAKRARAD
ncbi:hypothetical protein MSG28_009085 [Choristoneura fumiferana]|uniref:Uncharacterized protein n=1 Tax=Choristoneura fumiferana TaxID=7141 RepID=A0ACC0KXE1_CHOFU|nr:hypothetical protein MSG28_009085 [Choristoneura fumiferana]